MALPGRTAHGATQRALPLPSSSHLHETMGLGLESRTRCAPQVAEVVIAGHFGTQLLETESHAQIERPLQVTASGTNEQITLQVLLSASQMQLLFALLLELQEALLVIELHFWVQTAAETPEYVLPRRGGTQEQFNEARAQAPLDVSCPQDVRHTAPPLSDKQPLLTGQPFATLQTITQMLLILTQETETIPV